MGFLEGPGQIMKFDQLIQVVNALMIEQQTANQMFADVNGLVYRPLFKIGGSGTVERINYKPGE